MNEWMNQWIIVLRMRYRPTAQPTNHPVERPTNQQSNANGHGLLLIGEDAQKIKTKYQNKKSKQNIIQNENKGIRVYLTDDRFALHLDDQTDGQSWIEDI